TYDPVDAVVKILSDNWPEEVSRPTIGKLYEFKQIDLRAGDYVLVGRVNERQEFLGIGGLEYSRYVSVEIIVQTMESRERALELINRVRGIIRLKENWVYEQGGDSWLLLNMILRRVNDRSEIERGIYSFVGEVEWFTIEVTV
ncbi:MAG: hypothetical protein NZ941_00030, partial [Candidatus Caldarchaeum sp.]|nr:hypothetical protein [Candidatus Caldarchaeum sp.]